MEINMIQAQKDYNLSEHKFVYNKTEFFMSNGYYVDHETMQQMKMLYRNSVNEVVDLLRKLIPSGVTKESGTLDFDFYGSMKGLSEDTRYLLEFPSANGSLSIDADNNEARVVLEDNKVVSASNFETIKNTPLKYHRALFNKIVVGLSIYELRALLNELGVLEPGNDLDTKINEMYEKMEERRTFIDSIILKLLLTGEDEDKLRAVLFDYYMANEFDIGALDMEAKERTI